jgi:DNA-binding Xre family transcriptional regulator
MPKKKNKVIQSTYDAHIAKLTPQQKKKFDQGYQELVLSELLIALVKDDYVHAKKLTKEAGLPFNIVRTVRSGTKQNITLQSFMKIIQALGCTLLVKKDKQSYPLELIQN